MATVTKRKRSPSSEDTRKPVHTIHIAPIRVSIWENTSSEGNKFFSITWQRSYMKDGRWQHSNSVSSNNLLNLILALKQAEEWIRVQAG